MRISIDGTGRSGSPGAIEYTNFTIHRSVDMHLLMVLTTEGRAPLVPIRGHDLKSPELPEFQQTMTNAIEACKGNLDCQIETVERYGKAIEASPDGFGTTGLDEQRYENWVSDRSRPCASGTISVGDTASGMAMDPPYPVRPFSYSQDGLQDLAAAPGEVLERVCDAWLSWDSKEAVVSVRLPVYGFWVDAVYSGSISGGTRLQLIEQGPAFSFSLDRSTEWNDGALSGSFVVDDIGVGYINGPMHAPVSATITWSFSPEMQ